MTQTEILDKMIELDASDPITRPTNLTAEEAAFFDAEHDLSTALAKATTTAVKALDSQEAEDLSWAAFWFRAANEATTFYAQTKYAMDKVFKLSDEYKAQMAEKTGE